MPPYSKIIKLAGLAPKCNTWEQKENILDPKLIQQFEWRLVLQQIAGYSKLDRKPKDKAKETAEKAKGQKSADSNSEGSVLNFFAFTIGIFWLLAFGLYSSLFGLILGLAARHTIASHLLQDQLPIKI